MSEQLNKDYAVPVASEQLEPKNKSVVELLQGPDMTNTIVGVLIHIRRDHIALMSDSEAIYHQVKVPPEETDLSGL